MTRAVFVAVTLVVLTIVAVTLVALMVVAVTKTDESDPLYAALLFAFVLSLIPGAVCAVLLPHYLNEDR